MNPQGEHRCIRSHDATVPVLKNTTLWPSHFAFGEQCRATDKIRALVELHRPAKTRGERRNILGDFMTVKRIAASSRKLSRAPSPVSSSPRG